MCVFVGVVCLFDTVVVAHVAVSVVMFVSDDGDDDNIVVCDALDVSWVSIVVCKCWRERCYVCG